MTSFFKYLTYITLTIILSVVLGVSGIFLYLAPQLPQVNSLLDIKLHIPLRIYTNDGELIGEFGEKRRTPVNIEHVPDKFKQAFLAAEDDQFYQHSGISYKGLSRAILQMISGSRQQSGGSTITQQVAKNYFLTPEKTIIRKLREIFLALQMEKELNKEQILELYVNKIFLGHKSYGISAAAQTYYGKKINELTIAEMAMIAGLPKAPSSYNPLSNPERAHIRRDWILGRMLKLKYISAEEFQTAISTELSAKRHNIAVDVTAPYVAEMVRLEAKALLGEGIYSDGYSIYTTINGKMQHSAQQSIETGILHYDSRHGFKGGEYRLKDLQEDTKTAFFKNNRTITNLIPAIVISVTKDALITELENGDTVSFSKDDLSELTLYETEDISHQWKELTDIIEPARAVRLKLLQAGDPDNNIPAKYQLTQLPAAQGALVSLNSQNGAILSMIGGFEYYQSKFNRATQAKRQIGSNIKPFVYAAALANGYTAATLINDAPVVFNDSQLESSWRPDNADKQFLGPIRLRVALYRSRNLASVRLVQNIGLTNTINYLEKFGFAKSEIPRDLSISLGSPNFTPLELATGFAVFSNQGYKITPYIIQEIKNSDNRTIFMANPAVACDSCLKDLELDLNDTQNQQANSTDNTADEILPALTTPAEWLNNSPNYAPRVINREVAFIIDTILKDVIKRGTGQRAKSLKRQDIAGKTGTTNGPTDLWFSGYTPNIITTAWIGFDDNRNLGRREYASSAALPIWIDFMRTALENEKPIIRKTPNGITNVLINAETGMQAAGSDTNTLFEFIRVENLPKIKNESITSEEGSSVDLEELF